MRQFTRKEIIKNLWEKIHRREPIIVGGAGYGLMGTSAESAGLDILMAYNTGLYRMDGHISLTGYRPYCDCNADTLRLGHALDKVIQNIPVIAGIGPSDPYRSFDYMLDACHSLNYSGITNVPSIEDVADRAYFKNIIQYYGYGNDADIALIKASQKHDFFTIFYAFDEEALKRQLDAGVDCVSVHCGGTGGGLFKAPDAGNDFQTACKKTQRYYDIIQQEKPDTIYLTHGGPFENPEAVQRCFETVNVHGFIGASSIERIPVEIEVYNTIKEYQALTMR